MSIWLGFNIPRQRSEVILFRTKETTKTTLHLRNSRSVFSRPENVLRIITTVGKT